MAKNRTIPDAWDDDWEVQADNGGARLDESEEPSQTAMTRAERLAKHAESQRKLWESADTPEEPRFLPIVNNLPLTTDFKPALKVLSRKPAPKMITRKDPVTGMERLTLDDEEEDEDVRKAQPTAEELRIRQQKEREEKQRRYDEARAKIFGESSASPRTPPPGAVTPPQQAEGRQSHRGRGKGRGGGGAPRNAGGRTDSRRESPSTTATTSISQPKGSRELYDPNYSEKTGISIQKRPTDTTTEGPRQEMQAVRAPRGPDASGRGGFGFAKRGTKDG